MGPDDAEPETGRRPVEHRAGGFLEPPAPSLPGARTGPSMVRRVRTPSDEHEKTVAARAAAALVEERLFSPDLVRELLVARGDAVERLVR